MPWRTWPASTQWWPRRGRGAGRNREADMTRVIAFAVVALLAAGAGGDGPSQSTTRPDYPFKPVPFTRVQLTDDFWAPRIETNRTTTIPVAFQQCERTNRIYHFERA